MKDDSNEPNEDAPNEDVLSRLRSVVAKSPLPVALLDPSTRRFVEASSRTLELLDLRREDLADLDVCSLSDDPEATRETLALVRSGKLDGYEAPRRLRTRAGDVVECRITVRALDVEGTGRLALVFLSPVPDDGVDTEHVLGPERGITVGSLRDGGRVDRISTDIAELLGYQPRDLMGEALLGLVHPDDVETLRSAMQRAASDSTAVAVAIRVRGHDGQWRPVRVVLASSEPGDTQGFVIAPAETSSARSSDRVAQLERHLWRIAEEVEATGVIPTLGFVPNPSSMPELSDLSARQWEVLTRLLRGERPGAIARGMFLSPSTVRNHLSAIYRKVGVRSQSELIERVRRTG